MNEHQYCVILAGGKGARFWPVSRKAKPKQFLSFAPKGKTFLRMTYERFLGIVPQENIIVVSLTRYRDEVKRQIPELSDGNLLLEPHSRNTAPCIAFATAEILRRDPQGVFVVTPSDLLIFDQEAFGEAIGKSLEYAAGHSSLVALGVVPSRPDTNFGYIQAEGGTSAASSGQITGIKTFTEKPDAELAEVFVSSGEFLWNAGIFIWQAKVIKEELEKYCPEIIDSFEDWGKVCGTGGEEAFLENIYSACKRDSIDYTVMERTDRACVCPVKFTWDDIGNWDTFYKYIEEKDENGNAVSVDSTLLRDTSDCIIYSNGKRKLIAVSGLKHYAVVDTGDILMICPRDDKRLKEITSNIGLPDYEEFR
ncbi:MAG: sugar phosphate nucleotidyltransferase [Bacteroidia bacterium]|nr:sugar phosphate nucleotidyltransferase [Bacteroidia bacterium]